MHIHHVAIWAQDLEALKAFYCTLFGGQANGRGHKPSRSAPAWYASRGQSGADAQPQRLAALLR
ncbi:VOC family protein [Aeromonas sp. sif0611]|uniref:VOC family protein n=1 Tax=Aeromonas sp. sif0611 TaxID=2854787 RepID=UPI00210BC16D|nr:VOC family protein [Aeromonas sp. sif0611]